MSWPLMSHLPGFWDDANWADDKWAVYLQRRHGLKNWLQNRIDQLGHWLMGHTMPRTEWCQREHDQWPSRTGSYDPCEDHISYLRGACAYAEADALLASARERRSEFLK